MIVRCGVADLAGGERRRGSGGEDLLVAVGAEVEHRDLGQLAERQPPEEPGAVAEVGGAVHPQRHPLVVRAVGAGAPLPVVTLALVVVLGAVAPLVVGDLVVVPRDDPRVLRVQVLQVRVGLVLRVPAAVVGDRHHLARRVVGPDVLVALPHPVLTRGVLVEVVAEVEHGVEVVAPREVAVRREPAGLQVGARDDAEPEVAGRRAAARRGAGAADPAARAVVGEPVVVPGRRLQAGHVDLDGVVAARAGAEPAAAHDLAEAGVGGDLPPHGHRRPLARARRRRLGRGDAGPDQHGLGLGVAGGDAVRKHAVVTRRRSSLSRPGRRGLGVRDDGTAAPVARTVRRGRVGVTLRQRRRGPRVTARQRPTQNVRPAGRPLVSLTISHATATRIQPTTASRTQWLAVPTMTTVVPAA